jgi:hypothetical protein
MVVGIGLEPMKPEGVAFTARSRCRLSNQPKWSVEWELNPPNPLWKRGTQPLCHRRMAQEPELIPASSADLAEAL